MTRTGVRVALEDMFESFRKWRVALIFGWQDVAQRYRRSRIGAFWLTLNMLVFIAAIGAVFGTLFRAPMAEFLPYLCVSIITWNFLSITLNEGCTTFVASEGIILQVRMPLFMHIMRTMWRNIIILAHNIVIFPVVVLLVGGSVGWTALLAIPGLLLLCLNLSWMSLVFSLICTRFRDMTQVVTNLLQVMFYFTPVMWMTRTLPEHVPDLFFQLNPFYHFLQLIRAPLLNQYPDALSWIVALAIAVVGWVWAIVFFGKYRWRVAYWL
jgi:ABC-type polysaccharide/polyol phosphate export permease